VCAKEGGSRAAARIHGMGRLGAVTRRPGRSRRSGVERAGWHVDTSAAHAACQGAQAQRPSAAQPAARSPPAAAACPAAAAAGRRRAPRKATPAGAAATARSPRAAARRPRHRWAPPPPPPPAPAPAARPRTGPAPPAPTESPKARAATPGLRREGRHMGKRAMPWIAALIGRSPACLQHHAMRGRRSTCQERAPLWPG
jgi:hypothetical protein